MPEIIINSQVIAFPDSAQSPNWSEAVIQFAQAVEAALQITSGPFDVAPQTMDISAFNSSTDVVIPALSFPISGVRAAFIKYTVFRQTNSANAYEAGDMIVVYNPNNSSNEKWTLTQGNRSGSGAQIEFSITDTGQMRFSTTALAGSSHSGQLTFEARALQQS